MGIILPLSSMKYDFLFVFWKDCKLTEDGYVNSRICDPSPLFDSFVYLVFILLASLLMLMWFRKCLR
jgi:hypothetical protein